jgi:hypothetical protein
MLHSDAAQVCSNVGLVFVFGQLEWRRQLLKRPTDGKLQGGHEQQHHAVECLH